MSQQLTQAERVRIEHAYNRKQILWLTGLTKSQLSQMIFDHGVSWLMRYTGEESGNLIREVLSQPLIWAWWKNEWHRRDEGYLPALYERHRICPKEVAALYGCLHQGVYVRWTPPYTLLEQAYSKAVGAMHDSLHLNKSLANG